jgi:transposase
LQIKAFGESRLRRQKTDRVDAELIACFCAQQEPLAWQPPATEVRELQRLLARFEAVQDMRGQELNRRHEAIPQGVESGVGAERLRQQSVANLERMLTITAFIAVRLLQLREQLQQGNWVEADTMPCDRVLERDKWRILWRVDRKKASLPVSPPSTAWAYLAIARLGGFLDTKVPVGLDGTLCGTAGCACRSESMGCNWHGSWTVKCDRETVRSGGREGLN